MQILMVCSANRCRSPMAASLLHARLVERGSAAEVSSAGFGPADYPPSTQAVRVMADIGLDLAGHRSQRVDRARCADADLVIGMTRQHVIDLVLLDPGSWPRTFPLVDLVRRGVQIGPRRDGEHPEAWIHRAHGGRQRSSVLSLVLSDDVADPIGQSLAAFERTRSQLDRLTTELGSLLAPDGRVPPPAASTPVWTDWAF